jgi:hypothetical protein
MLENAKQFGNAKDGLGAKKCVAASCMPRKPQTLTQLLIRGILVA